MGLSNKDIAGLTWFFSEGIAAFEKSTCGPMLERAETYAVKWEWNRPEVTARPTAEHRDHGGVEPDRKLLIRYGTVSRRLRGCSELCNAVLKASYGDEGAKWARHERGYCVALFGFTRAGKTLVEQARSRARGANLELSDFDRLKSLIEVDHVSNGTDAIRRALINKATKEAIGFYSAACAEYAATATPQAKGA